MRTRAAIGSIGLGLAVALAAAAPTDAASAPEHGYVTTSVVFQTTASDARALGRDLNGDGIRDNALSNVFIALMAQGLDLTGTQDADVADGQIVMLQSLRTPSLASSTKATWQVWYGKQVADPDLSGSGRFKVAAGAIHSARLATVIRNHTFSTAPGSIPLLVDVGGGPFRLDLLSGRAFATCRTLCTGGRINGAIRESAIDVRFIPKLAESFQAMVTRDCPGPAADSCVGGSPGMSAEVLFDVNQDLVITSDEVRASSFVQALLQPDVDLFKADGTRGHDGVKDSISFAFGYTATKATIVHE